MWCEGESSSIPFVALWKTTCQLYSMVCCSVKVHSPERFCEYVEAESSSASDDFERGAAALLSWSRTNLFPKGSPARPCDAIMVPYGSYQSALFFSVVGSSIILYSPERFGGRNLLGAAASWTAPTERVCRGRRSLGVEGESSSSPWWNGLSLRKAHRSAKPYSPIELYSPRGEMALRGRPAPPPLPGPMNSPSRKGTGQLNSFSHFKLYSLQWEKAVIGRPAPHPPSVPEHVPERETSSPSLLCPGVVPPHIISLLHPISLPPGFLLLVLVLASSWSRPMNRQLLSSYPVCSCYAACTRGSMGEILTEKVDDIFSRGARDLLFSEPGLPASCEEGVLRAPRAVVTPRGVWDSVSRPMDGQLLSSHPAYSCVE